MSLSSKTLDAHFYDVFRELSPCRIASKVRVSIARAAVRSGGDNERDAMLDAGKGAPAELAAVLQLLQAC